MWGDTTSMTKHILHLITRLSGLSWGQTVWIERHKNQNLETGSLAENSALPAVTLRWKRYLHLLGLRSVLGFPFPTSKDLPGTHNQDDSHKAGYGAKFEIKHLAQLPEHPSIQANQQSGPWGPTQPTAWGFRTWALPKSCIYFFKEKMTANLGFNFALLLALAMQGPINFATSDGMKLYRGAVEPLQKVTYAGDPHSFEVYLENLSDRAMTLWLEWYPVHSRGHSRFRCQEEWLAK